MVKLRVNGQQGGRPGARRSGEFATSIRRLPIGDRFAFREKRGRVSPSGVAGALMLPGQTPRNVNPPEHRPVSRLSAQL